MTEVIGINLDSLVKKFGNVIAVNNINFNIKPGEFFALLGPSGCGKTTTLRLVAGLEEATEGRIMFDDEDVTYKEPKERDVAMVFQDYALYPHMTVAENIGYPLKVRKINKNEIRKKVKETSKQFKISNLLERKPNQLSGGQQQRVALARALVHQPKVFLFDEPLSNLDARLRLESRTFLKHFQSELGITTIYVTHDQSEALALADRIAVLKDGQIRQIGTPREVYENPSDSFVADFIGDPPMNLIDCKLEDNKDNIEIHFPETSVSIPKNKIKLNKPIDLMKDYIFGIRPENVFISENESDIKSEIYAIETLGATTLVTLQVGNSRVRLTLERNIDLEIEQLVQIKFDYNMVRIYEKESGSLIN
ncbi:ABC transporter ATP-binding protein [Halanaerobium kushneri]|jgi:ABC-type sugar transport system ATPase subunit|uniref:Carbohydrate ABC transporter ATP-binding protein, CUT1 family n=1 Tax=Halanaerobium kushneri TaxID=56779 RepID=A0A1N6R1K3_9FIRM|nr:ABC transporter ATP-binding protein [Halanaerobium kushneri]SIQ22734.1 carbohydrate ABC transporter ATP-binding protein, CUT1 family [Halanaerobium kushneri]